MAEIIFWVSFGGICACFCAVTWSLAVKLKRVTVIMEMYKEIAEKFMEKAVRDVMDALKDLEYNKERAEKQEDLE